MVAVTPPRAPWWQAARSPRLALVLGSVWLLVFVVDLLVGLSDGEWPWFQVVTLVLAGLLGPVYVLSGVAQLRTRPRPSSPDA